MNILVIIAGLIVIVSAFAGYCKGFFRTAITMCSFILAMAIVTVVNPVVTTLAKEHIHINEAVHEMIKEALEQQQEALEDEVLEGFGNGLDLPNSWEHALEKLNTKDAYSQLGIDEMVEHTVSYYTNIIIRVISYIISLIIATVLIRIAMVVFDIAAGLPILSGLNRLAGLGLGFFRGLIILWIAGLVIAICSGNAWTAPVLGMIKESGWLTFLYRHNLLAMLLSIAVALL